MVSCRWLPAKALQGNKYWGGRIGYAAGPFDIAGAYGKTECLDPPGNIDLDNWNIGGSWNFGFMKLSGFFSSISADRPMATMAGRDNWYVGVSAPFGQWNFKASYGGTNGKDLLDNVDATQWAIGADYNLSKRTALYATWSSINNDNGAGSRVSTQAAIRWRRATTRPASRSACVTPSDRAAAARQSSHRQRPPSGGLFYGRPARAFVMSALRRGV